MIQYIQDDLFAADERAIAHGCNCHGVMGKGFAKEVKKRFPQAFKGYETACIRKEFYPGCAQPVRCSGPGVGELTTVYNLATQNAPGANGDIRFIERAFLNMRSHMYYVGNRRIAMPKIGSGIAKVPWEMTEASLNLVFGGDFDVVVYVK